MFQHISEFYSWFSKRTANNQYDVQQIPLENMGGWGISYDSGNITHVSGKFFSVMGVDVTTDHRATERWQQPIIVQPEIGILGILVKVVAGTVYCLMQAKMEPGNINLLQLSPTVQATRSNYTRVHKGDSVPYLEHFITPRPDQAVFDTLQSEQGSWFLRKRNRNMIVLATSEVTVLDNFCWLSFDQISTLMAVPNLLNMDSRTVLSGIPFLFSDVYGDRLKLSKSSGLPHTSLHSIEYLLSWFTDMKARFSLARELIPLRTVSSWSLTDGAIVREDGRHFSVIGVDVRASNREVGQWSQPMLKPSQRGVIAFIGRYINETFHILVHARTEAGTNDIVEMAPTVGCIPSNYDGMASEDRPLYLDVVREAKVDSILVDVVHSEEGGRFYHAENRYLVIDAGEDFELEAPLDYCWMTVDQLTSFVRYGNYVNVGARCLLSCLIEESASLAPKLVK
ncbi:NDP-hexose 2,3-dehydratase family protein [Rhodococcoides yunnanense]|uniref:NDP-hexose 2,3-dehydratase family protein n=1 Tax=Rhodococcoides yunnanense TaxID=278209 RepID=A0ABU4BIA5_9NOCA|nr:NDP-hexose 2,3-dehydratase family protein [Rhodococcus yunnanensis]MDV6263926.1 NDP-hexose 2,3-dehydratase family protein [Rhodococcus yunnanensis]